MRCSTVSGLMMAALVSEAVAGPLHAHLHQRAHQKKDVDWEKLDWEHMGIDWSAAYEAGQHSKTAAPVVAPTPSVAASSAPAAAAATTPAAAPAQAKSTPSSSSSAPKAESTASSAADSVSAGAIFSDVTDSVSDLFAGLVGAANNRKSFGKAVSGSGAMGDNRMGNVGSPYGSNVLKVSSTKGYDFTTTFMNTSPSKMTINCWNKNGPDGQVLSGSSLAPKDTTLTMALKPGQSQIVAFQDDSQIACSQATNNIAASGAYAEGWFEAQFRKEGSGFDYSAIMSSGGNNYDMQISAEEVECVSDNTQNYWLTATQPIGGSDGSCYVPGSTMHLTAKFGGHTS